MLKTYWLDSEYRAELLKDAFTLFPKRESLSLIKDYFLKRVDSGPHLLKFETIWELFHDKNLKTILDIGASLGDDSLTLSRIFNKAMIYSFEADNKNYKKCLKNTEFRNNISTFNTAISDNTGEELFYPSEDIEGKDISFEGCGSILKPTAKNSQVWENLRFKNPVKVPTLSLKDWADKEKISSIDFIWMDVQGAEMLVLKGMGDLLYKTKGVVAEIWSDDSFYEGCPKFSDLTAFFEKNNFYLSHLWNCSSAGDALFLNKEYAF